MAAKTLACAALCCALAAAQGIATRNVKPAARAKASGRPWPLAPHQRRASRPDLRIPRCTAPKRDVQYLAETSSGGIALFDYDNDGWLDIFVVSGTRFEGAPPEATNRLYRNNHDGTFADVTDKAGLRRTGWGQGVAVGDYDNDGHLDLFVTYWGENALYRNNGDGTFTDVAVKAGLTPENQARLPALVFGRDLRRLRPRREAGPVRRQLHRLRSRRSPQARRQSELQLEGSAHSLRTARTCARRARTCSTTAATARSKMYRRSRASRDSQSSFGFTAVAADFDDDGWQDIYLACDSTPSLFFHNNHDGTFTEEGIERGVALNPDGMEQAGMGLAVADFDGDGILDILKTHFADDTPALYRGLGKGQFEDVTQKAGLAVETRYVSWGAAIADLDNDGLPDIFIVTGNVYPDTERHPARVSLRHPGAAVPQSGQRRIRATRQQAGRAGPGRAAFLARHWPPATSITTATSTS